MKNPPPQERARIEFVFMDNGDVKFDISGDINYLQMFGCASMLAETARVQFAQANMKAMLDQGPGLEVVRGMPGTPKSGD